MYNTSPYSLSRSFRDKPCRAVIYGRASTEHEAQVKALQNQMQWYDDVARFHPQWNVINRYIDQGITGTQVYKRDAFMQMMEDAKQHKFDLIVTREVCRLARNTVDALVCVRQLAAMGIEVYFVNDNIWTLDGDGELRLTIMATMAQEESRKISERSLAGQRVSREKGVLDDLVVVRARGEIEQDKFLQRTIEIQQQMEALRQSKAQIASEDYNPGRLDMEAIEAALCEAVEMHDGLVSEDFIDLFVSQVTPLSDSRFAWCLDFSPQPTVAFLNLAGQRKYTTCSMDSKLHFGPFADGEENTIPFLGSLRR